ncbi:MAG: hypothetical protein Q7K48_08060 [Fusobacterium sp. JB021]|nr:hypothetical protein [Fusobacterium sp. JB020]MDP0494238.1 hypothetical protein [Fusobacterium sp. JB021]MDP0505723.1 hypothetical protein [Fusobacterium sp. JB019]
MAGVKGKSGRKSQGKVKKMFGYRYTQQEYEYLNKVLTEARTSYKTTSRSILEIFKYYEKGLS